MKEIDKQVEKLRKFIAVAGVAEPVEALALALADKVDAIKKAGEELIDERDEIIEHAVLRADRWRNRYKRKRAENIATITDMDMLIDELKIDVDALVKLVAQSRHEEHCRRENWWDSLCDCGLHDMITQLTIRVQKAIDDEQKNWIAMAEEEHKHVPPG